MQRGVFGGGGEPPPDSLSFNEFVAGRGGQRNGGFGGQRPPTKNLNDFPPAGEAGGKNSKISLKYYCYNNNNSRPLGRPFFHIIINTTN